LREFLRSAAPNVELALLVVLLRAGRRLGHSRVGPNKLRRTSRLPK